MAVDRSILLFFAQYIEKEIGIIYSDTNYFQLEHRLEDITKLLGFSTLEEMYSKAKSGIFGQMRDLLLDLATNNETSFFRDAGVFKMVSELLIPELKKARPSLHSVSLWSAASSTGQEAYSIAMTIDQAHTLDPLFPDYAMLVSDFSDRVLKRCQEGLYSQLEVQRGLPAKFLVSYFDKENENSWKVKTSLRSKMRFRQLNLLDPFPSSIGSFDIIFCRNVLIYQSVENKTSVVKKMLDHLNPGGFLVLGAAESLIGISDQFKQVQHGTAVAYQKK